MALILVLTLNMQFNQALMGWLKLSLLVKSLRGDDSVC